MDGLLNFHIVGLSTLHKLFSNNFFIIYLFFKENWGRECKERGEYFI